MELYLERGFDETTVAAIAERAGLTERTFFRHFADKREVFFAGTTAMLTRITDTVRDAPEGLGALVIAARAIDAAAGHISQRGFSRQRQAIIDATPELQERELIKLAGWSSTIAETLRERGFADPAAGLAAESAVSVFKVAFGRWLASDDERALTDYTHEAFAELRSLTAA